MTFVQQLSTPVTEITQKLDNPQEIGFVFDIDGVLLKGKERIKEATDVIKHLQAKKVPFILLTNGGGMKEKKRIDFINMTLQLEDSPIHEDQLVQAHTPMKTLIPHHRRVLVLGGPGDDAREVAESYGFEEVLRPVDLIRANPTIWPYHMYTEEQINTWGKDPKVSKVSVNGPPEENLPIDSVLCFNDSRELGGDLQLALELIGSEGGVLGTRRNYKSSKPSIPIIFSNNDFLWSNEYKLPRFAMGALKIAIMTIYEKINGQPLEQLTLGKPEKVCYDYAHHILIDWRKVILGEKKAGNLCLPTLNDPPINTPFKKVYMVGDNPESDITGGNNYNWGTILVRTGVYTEGDFERNPETSRPSLGIFANVKEGVLYALKQNGLE